SFLAACGMLAYGLGAILRHTAGAITAAIGLLFVLSVLVNFLPSSWQDHVDKWMPALAGGQVWATKVTPAAHQFPAWGGFAVLAGYAAVAVVVGLGCFPTPDALPDQRCPGARVFWAPGRFAALARPRYRAAIVTQRNHV